MKKKNEKKMKDSQFLTLELSLSLSEIIFGLKMWGLNLRDGRVFYVMDKAENAHRIKRKNREKCVTE